VIRPIANVKAWVSIDPWSALTGQRVCTLEVGKKELTTKDRRTKAEWRDYAKSSTTEPAPYRLKDGTTLWRYKEQWFKAEPGLTDEDVKAVIVSRDLGRQQEIKKAKTIAAAGRMPDGSLREPIPKNVRLTVWERDHGKCRSCGSTEELQCDHIIPVSMGGADSVENLQILCGTCNRKKGASVG